MAFDPCNPCGCIPANIGPQLYYQMSISLFCQMLALQDGESFVNIASATTTVVKSGSGVLRRIVVNKPVASGVYTIYDNIAASGTKIGTVTQPGTLLQSQITLEYGAAFSTGLTIVTSSTDDITVVYS